MVIYSPLDATGSWNGLKIHMISIFGNLVHCFNFWPNPNFYKVLVSSTELPTARSIIMPCRKKVSAWAKSKQQSSQSTFTHEEEDISKHRFVYNDSGKEAIWYFVLISQSDFSWAHHYLKASEGKFATAKVLILQSLNMCKTVKTSTTCWFFHKTWCYI